jgi:thioesterase domain-containing protein
LGYRSLAQHLGADQPVYGLQAQYPEDLEGEHSPAAVDELAGEYLSALRKVQPHGPYQFVGLCRGAHIAFEMARRLQTAGEQVGFVGILDTWVLENTYNRFLFVEYYFRRLVSLLRLRPHEQLRELRKKLPGSSDSSQSSGQTATTGGGRQSRNPMAVYFPGPEFVPRTFAGQVSVFRARKQPLNRIRDKELGWGKLAEGGVDLHYVPGLHGASILSEPNVQVLAEAMKKCLVT